MKSFVFLSSLLFSTLAFAQIYQVSEVDLRQKVLHVYYSENGHFYREKIVVHASGYQDRLSREIWPLGDWQKQRRQERFPLAISDSATGLVTQSRGLVLWKTTQAWDENWEKKFGEWIDTEVTKSFMVKHNLSTDCADAMITFRWIFARLNGLPAANTLSGGGLFTNESFRSEWTRLPTHAEWDKDARFLKGLEYVLDNTYTHTLERDSYPLKIDRQFFFSGTVHLSIHEASGHTMIVHQVAQSDKEVPFLVYYSNLPKIVRELYKQIWYGERPRHKVGGFMRARWPQYVGGRWKLLERAAHIAYSEEQYEETFAPASTPYTIAIYRHLFPTFDVIQTARFLIDGIREQILQRIQIVEDGHRFCQTHICTPGSVGFEDWSTPTRDQRILDGWQSLTQFQQFDGTGAAAAEARSFADKPLIPLGGEVFTPNAFVMFALRYKFADSDPRVDIETRWGLTPAVVAQKLASTVRNALASRDRKISNPIGPCSPSQPHSKACLYLSKNWKDAATDKEDSELNSLSSVMPIYCAHVPTGCTPADAILAPLTFTANGQTKTLKQWLSDAIWFNSDPRLPAGPRWEGRLDQLKWVRTMDFCELSVAKNMNAVGADCKGGQSIVQLQPDAHTYRELFPGRKFKRALLTEDGKTAIVSDGTGHRRLNLETGLEIAGFDTGAAQCSVVEANRQWVACTHDRILTIRDWETGSEKIALPHGDYVLVDPKLTWMATVTNNPTRQAKFISWDSHFNVVEDRGSGELAYVVDQHFVQIGPDLFKIVGGRLQKFSIAAGQKLNRATQHFVGYTTNGEICLRGHATTAPYFCTPETQQAEAFPMINGEWLSVMRQVPAHQISISQLLDISSGQASVLFQSPWPSYNSGLHERAGIVINTNSGLLWIDRK